MSYSNNCNSSCSSGCNSNNSNSNSACVLKEIIDHLDDLDTKDLCTLRDLIERILSCRS